MNGFSRCVVMGALALAGCPKPGAPAAGGLASPEPEPKPKSEPASAAAATPSADECRSSFLARDADAFGSAVAKQARAIEIPGSSGEWALCAMEVTKGGPEGEVAIAMARRVAGTWTIGAIDSVEFTVGAAPWSATPVELGPGVHGIHVTGHVAWTRGTDSGESHDHAVLWPTSTEGPASLRWRDEADRGKGYERSLATEVVWLPSVTNGRYDVRFTLRERVVAHGAAPPEATVVLELAFDGASYVPKP